MTKSYYSPKLRAISKAVLIALPMLATLSVTRAENTTDFATGALAGAAVQYSPNVLLALSVEYPTAGLAYTISTGSADTNVGDGNPQYFYNTKTIKNRYLGYFDNRKCYEYHADPDDSDASRAFNKANFSTTNSGGYAQAVFHDGFSNNNRTLNYVPYNENAVEYFHATRDATDTEQGIGLCDGVNEFSGNMLNWASMSAIDIFRQALTGGNRAATLKTDENAYLQGDSEDATYLRRANVVVGQNSRHFGSRYIYLPDDLLRKVLPHDYASDDLSKFVTYTPNGPNDKYEVTRAISDYWDGKNGAYLKKYFGETGNAIVLVNNQGFWVNFRRRFRMSRCSALIKGGNWQAPNNCAKWIFPDDTSIEYEKEVVTQECVNQGWWGKRCYDVRKTVKTRDPSGYYALPLKSRYMPYQAVVKVCDDPNSVQTYSTEHPKTSIQCTQYPNGKYKPTGLMQERASDMRFGAVGYANVNSAKNAIHGGVLRARMKSLLGGTAIQTNQQTGSEVNLTQQGSVPLGQEIDINTGKFIVNPDASDASKSKVSNSGVINYLNKFGDLSGYKDRDPAAELYYVAQRYLRNAGFPNEYNSFGTSTLRDLAISQSNDNIRYKDNFPVILDWDNPLVVGSVDNTRENACRPNQIVLIGDTNTHYDNDLPNFAQSNAGGIDTPYQSVTDPDDINTNQILQNILQNEGQSHRLYTNEGAANSRLGLAALAYWGKTHDIQKNITGIQNINTFAIDVVEVGNYKTAQNNSYYLAAKYGGFTYDKYKTHNADGSTYVPMPRNRSDWTDDAQGQTSIPQFSVGVPRTYAAAQNPEDMIKALKSAINSAPGVEAATQSRVTTDVSTEKAVNLVQGIGVLRSGFTEQSPTYSGTLKKQLLKLVYDPSNPTGTFPQGFKTIYSDNCSTCWDAGKRLNDMYHNQTSWSARNVYTTVNHTVTKFATDNASTLQSELHKGILAADKVDATKLVSYVLGNSTNESASDLRVRSGYLMGTVINSSPTAIRPLAANSVRAGSNKTCKFSDANFAERNKETRYAVAANDGMLHLFNGSGEEVLAYLPNAILPKLNNYAKRTYIEPAYDRWLNDGTASVNEVCNATEARSILIGTTGRGGNSVYALDVTNLQSPNEHNILWDFSHEDLGMTIPAPIVTHDKDGNPIAIISSGYRKNGGNDKGYVFVLKNINEKHTNWTENVDYYKIPLGKAGVGEIFALDANNDNAAEAIYVGDLEGKLWKLTPNADGNFAVNGGRTDATDKPLFVADAPIVGQPAVQTISGKTYVVFATGRFFGDKDLPTITNSLQNYAYGIIDKGDGVTIENNTNNLVQQEIVTDGKLTVNSVDYLKVTNNKIDDTKQGWRLKLGKNMLNMDAASIYKNRLAQFTLITPGDGSVTSADENICKRSGSTSTVLVDVRTGGAYTGNLFDTNNDGKFNSKDGHYSVMTTNNNIVQKALTFQTINGTTMTIGYGSNGSYSVATNPLYVDSSIKRLSWREIY